MHGTFFEKNEGVAVVFRHKIKNRWMLSPSCVQFSNQCGKHFMI